MKLTWRVWILIIAILLSILAIGPSFESGVRINYVEKNSELFNAGLRPGEVIKTINGLPITTVNEYSKAVSDIQFVADGTKFDLQTKQGEYTVLLNSTPTISVEKISRTNIKTGLDLQGGSRALVQPDINITDSQLQDLIEVSRNRFNVYGLADVQIRAANDLSGNKYMIIEIAGATPGDLQQLVAQQGKFEAKVGNRTVFEGGEKDIADVCRNKVDCAGITQCDDSAEGSVCAFRFTVYLTEKAAQKHADVTKNISIDSTGQYLSEKLYLYVDEQEVDSLLISTDLRGQVTTQISIQGSGTGKDREEAFDNANENMNKLQTVLITGSLPYKLNVVKLDTISPTLGSEFAYWILIAGAASIIAVSIIVFVKYRNIKSSLAVLLTSFSELIIILGVASLIKWNLDLPSIAGILATIGTGVDSQIVLLDEAEDHGNVNIKQRMKRALFVVFSSYFTALVALLPLMQAGAGLYRGFAVTTIIGITAGVLITRPAFSDIIKTLGKD